MYIECMKKKIENAFSPSSLEIIDESYKHVGHKGAGSGGHFKIKIVSNAFQNKSKVQIHRMIYKVFDEDMPSKIHALAIEAKS